MNTGATPDELLAELLDASNGAGQKMRARGVASARRYVIACWAKALRRATSRPGIRDRSGALDAIATIRAAAAAKPWNARSGPYDFAVLEAHLTMASRAGKLAYYHADVRTVAEEAGVAPSTVSAAHRRFRHAGWLRLVRAGGEANAGVWTLRLPRRVGRYSYTQISDTPESALGDGGPSANTRISPTGDAGECANTARAVPVGAGADVWRRRALGKAALNVWRLLDGCQPQKTSTIAGRLSRQRRTLRRHLVRLERVGLALHDGDGWRRGDTDLNLVAKAIGIAGYGDAERERHEDERLAYRVRFGASARRANRGDP